MALRTFVTRPRLRVAVSGSSGLIGSALAALLESGGHRVVRLVRRAAGGEGELSWDPAAGSIDRGGLEGLDALVHLAGENIAAGRWTERQKARIRDSRIQGTRLVAGALAGLERPPRVMINASAIGYYGNRGDEQLDEQSAPGSDFLARTCVEWERATAAAAGCGIRVVLLRTGIVLSPKGGALARMLLPFKLGLGGRLGSGRQYMSWIGHLDLLRIIHLALFEEALSGPVNAVAPHPVSNREFTRTLARVLHRPALFPAPAPLIRLALGEMGDAVLLGGARVLPRKLEQIGFRHEHPELEQALRFHLGRFDDRFPRPEMHFE